MMHDCNAVWNGCLSVIREEISEQSFKTWFEPIRPIRLQENTLTLQVPNRFFFEWLEEHYLPVLRKSIRQTLGPKANLEYNYVKDDPWQKSGKRQKPVSSTPATEEELDIRNPFVIPGIKRLKIDPQLNTTYTFDNLIVGDCNRLACSAAEAIANNPGGTAFNPLFIFGDVGLGKTHLAQAIGNSVVKQRDDKTVLYVSSEKFTNQIIEAIKNNAVSDFTNFYQLVNLLIIDDIQFLAGKTKTQEIFFHIFNQLHQSGNQIVITSDRAPKDLQGMEERLISRFKWGLSADLQAPDYETMMAILEHKSSISQIIFTPEVKHYICDNIRHNIRELEGVIISLIAHASLTKKEIDIELAQRVIYNVVLNKGTIITLDHIKKCVADHYEVPIDKLKSQTRKRNIVLARQLSMYFAKNITNHSLKSIGDSFGGRDHSTVIYSVRAVNDMMDTNAEFKRTVKDIEKKLRQPVNS
ncbi:MAG TPA: chromosomal replication initiator protein DnaA [Saprospiraceae bacterium]|nr:chromosomal replication initiator protein DnaA [Saprospiraceae bacterium]